MKSIYRIEFVAAALALFAVSCSSAPPTGLPVPMADRADRERHGYTYYLDGAGGGTAKKNWAGGVQEGLIAAGYPGAGEMFSWETGDGLLSDQKASVKFKRSKAKEMAAELERRAQANPGVPVNIIGFSAGTAIAIFALEYLPESVQVDRVVLLGTSISEDYDLTEALRRVKDRLYMFTSQHDRMLGTLMPLSGTADRKYHDPGAGITGFVLPPGSTAETRLLYAEKISTIRWSPVMKLDGDKGHHFDNVKPEFIRDYVAPLLKASAEPGPGGAPDATASPRPAPAGNPAAAPAPTSARIPAPAPVIAPLPARTEISVPLAPSSTLSEPASSPPAPAF